MFSPALGKIQGLDHTLDLSSAGGETYQMASLQDALTRSVVEARSEYFGIKYPNALSSADRSGMPPQVKSFMAKPNLHVTITGEKRLPPCHFDPCWCTEARRAVEGRQSLRERRDLEKDRPVSSPIERTLVPPQTFSEVY